MNLKYCQIDKKKRHKGDYVFWRAVQDLNLCISELQSDALNHFANHPCKRGMVLTPISLSQNNILKVVTPPRFELGNE